VRIDVKPFKIFADKNGIGYGTCHWILTVELGMHHVAAKFVSRILTADQKWQHVNVCEEPHQITSDNANLLAQGYHW
jgi:hypothetical protein